MDYVDYCHRLVAELVETESRITYGGHTSITVAFLLHQLHGQGDMVGWDDSSALDIQAFRHALEDMIQRGYVQGYFKLFQVSSSLEGRSFARDPVSHWAESCRRKLNHECDQLLRAINEQSEHRDGILAFRRWVDYGQLILALGWSSDVESLRQLDKTVRNLYVEGLVEFGGSPNLDKSRVR